ncbi:hypothetical protein GCM10009552_00830 [Rothia nasimurium]
MDMQRIQNLIEELRALVQVRPHDRTPSAGNLAAPVVREAVNDRIDPTSVTSIHIDIPSGADIQPSDTVLFEWSADSVEGSWTQSFNNLGAGKGVLIDKEVRLPNLGKAIDVTYWRIRNGQSDRSDRYTVRMGSIHDDAPGLPQPGISEASAGTLDMGSFQGDAHVRLDKFSLIAPGQRFWLSLNGTHDQGHPVTLHLAEAEQFSDNPPDPMPLASVPRNWLDNLLDASKLTVTVSITYDGSRDKSKAIRLRPRELTLKVPGAPSLQAPAVSAAEGPNKDVLRPEALIAKQSISVYISSRNDFQAGDTLTLHWDDGTKEGSRDVPMNPAQAGGTVYVDKDVIARNQGHSVKVYFTLHRKGFTYDSPTLNLLVQRIPDQSPDWPRSIVKEGPQKDLDLSTFKGDAHLTIEPFHFMEKGQRYWIEARGRVGGNGKTEYVATGKEFITTGGPTIATGEIDRTWLETLDDLSQLWIDTWVTFDGSRDKAKAVQFRRTTLVVHAMPSGFTETFESLTPKYPTPLPLPYKLQDITITSGPAFGYVYSNDPYLQGTVLIAQTNAEIDLGRDWRHLEFGKMYAGTVQLLRSNRTVLDTVSIPAGKGLFTYLAPQNDTFRYIRFTGNNYVDNLSCKNR